MDEIPPEEPSTHNIDPLSIGNIANRHAYHIFSSVSPESVDAELCERSLYQFVKISWPVLHPTTPFVDGWHIGALTEHLTALVDGQIKKLIINMPVKMTKSVIASIDLPAWVWGPKKWPSSSWLYASYKDDLASEHSVYCRKLIESPWYQRHWGHVFKLVTDQNQKMNFHNDKVGFRQAFHMTGVTGRGAFFNVCDDPHDRNDWKYPNEIKRHVDAYDADIYNAVTDPANCRRLVVGHRVAPNDLSGHLKGQGGWEVLVIPTEYDPKKSKISVIGWKDPRTKYGELACEARWPRAEVDIAKKNIRLFSAFHQGEPLTSEGRMFPREYWRFYTEDPRNVIGMRIREAQLAGRALPTPIYIQSWDCSFKDLQTSSLVAGHVWCKLGADMILLDRIGDHLDFNKTLTAVVRMTEKWPEAKVKVIEEKANGGAVIAFLKHRISGMIAWPPAGVRMDSKEARAAVLQPDHQAGNFWLPDPDKFPWVNEVVEWFAAFPDAEYDDDCDAASQAYAYFERFSGSGWGQGWRPL